MPSVSPRVLVASLAISVVLVLAGCGAASTSGSGKAASEATAAPGTGRDLKKATPEGAPMPGGVRSQQLTKGFPTEVPVADGTVIESKGQDAGGRGVWMYTVDTDASVPGLTAWYRMVYKAANWETVKDSISNRHAELELRKGDAQSIITIRERPGGGARVQATVDLAMPAAPAN